MEWLAEESGCALMSRTLGRFQFQTFHQVAGHVALRTRLIGGRHQPPFRQDAAFRRPEFEEFLLVQVAAQALHLATHPSTGLFKYANEKNFTKKNNSSPPGGTCAFQLPTLKVLAGFPTNLIKVYLHFQQWHETLLE